MQGDMILVRFNPPLSMHRKARKNVLGRGLNLSAEIREGVRKYIEGTFDVGNWAVKPSAGTSVANVGVLFPTKLRTAFYAKLVAERRQPTIVLRAVLAALADGEEFVRMAS